MFIYDKKLQYPVKIDKPNPRLAAIIISQYGGPDGELGASLRYLSQRYSMPFDELKGLLTDIGTEGPLWHRPEKSLCCNGFSAGKFWELVSKRGETVELLWHPSFSASFSRRSSSNLASTYAQLGGRRLSLISTLRLGWTTILSSRFLQNSSSSGFALAII